ncbi:uncharacterized protein LOC128335292 isoform X3 [Hemicordylus capensis]|uniref:uncharacterized protein LOC128335292 isoform X3 n=1 Tax=Hemicordylus capensis TaxID=884348 RepID=UPI002303E263|nr:uncharacterized protein LOC128335292 isoform X3 [Hemicordylus capensis]
MAFFVWVLALAITSLIVLIYIYQKMGGSRWRRQVRKHRRVRVDHQRLRKHPSKKTEHRMPGPVYVEQPWLTECLSQGDCYFKCGQWRKEKPAHHMRRPLSPPLQTPALSTTKDERTRPYFVETDPNHPNLSCGPNRRAVLLQQVGREKVLRHFRKLAEPPLETPALSTSKTDPTRPYFVKKSRKRKRPYDPGEGPRIKRRRIWP